MDPLTAVPWSALGWGGLIAATFIAVVRGWLVPKLTQDRIEALYADRLKDRDARIAELVRTNELLDARNDMLAHQIGELIDGVRTANAVVAALPTATRGA